MASKSKKISLRAGSPDPGLRRRTAGMPDDAIGCVEAFIEAWKEKTGVKLSAAEAAGWLIYEGWARYRARTGWQRRQRSEGGE